MPNAGANAYGNTRQRVRECIYDALPQIRKSRSAAELVAISLSLAETLGPIKSARKRYEAAAVVLRIIISVARFIDAQELVSHHAKAAAKHTRKVQKLLSKQQSDLATTSPLRVIPPEAFDSLSAVA